MDSNFVLPKIPTIFVEEEPPKRKSQRDKQIRRKKSEDESKKKFENQSAEANHVNVSKPVPDMNGSIEVNEVNIANEINEFPKLELCAACSRVILTYFKPLQMYITDIVKLAEAKLKLDDNDNVNAKVNEEENETASSINIEETKRQFSQENYEHRDRKQEINGKQSVEWHVQNEPLKSFSTAEQTLREEVPSNTSFSEHVHHFETNSDQFKSNFESPETAKSNNENINYHTDNVSENVNETVYVETKLNEESVDQRETEKTEYVGYRKESEVECSHKIGITEDITEKFTEKLTSDKISESQIPKIVVENYSHEENNGAECDNSFTGGSMSISSEMITHSSEGGKFEKPFAVVTIANSNLAAANAIALVNSFHLTNNNVLFDKNRNSKIFVPFVIILGGNIDPLLKRTVIMIFDEVIYDSGDLRLTLLNDKTLGMKLYKLQLWKSLEKYEKCLFLESSTIVVGHITNLLFDCTELSAAVDYLFPDYFNCSVFIFCPSSNTYEELVKFAVSSQVTTSKLNPDNHDVIDEMTILNTFFADKWNRLSFVYNYVQNDSIYSQTPAFLRFGNEIKIVNFGYMGTSLSTLQSSTFVTQPWHISFDLLTSSQSDKVDTTFTVNKFTQFYLLIFMKRLWPILQKPMMKLLPPPSFGRRNWTVFELIGLMSSKSGHEIEDHMFNQNQITFRRKNSVLSEQSPLTQTEKTPETLEATPATPEITPATPDVSPSISEKTGVASDNKNLSETSKAEESTAVDPESVDEDVVTDTNSQKAAWESGRVDWMGVHRSDTIIERLKGKIDSNS